VKATLKHAYRNCYGSDFVFTGAWRYMPDTNDMEIEVTYMDRSYDDTTRFTKWLAEEQIVFYYEVRPDE